MALSCANNMTLSLDRRHDQQPLYDALAETIHQRQRSTINNNVAIDDNATLDHDDGSMTITDRTISRNNAQHQSLTSDEHNFAASSRHPVQTLMRQQQTLSSTMSPEASTSPRPSQHDRYGRYCGGGGRRFGRRRRYERSIVRRYNILFDSTNSSVRGRKVNRNELAKWRLLHRLHRIFVKRNDTIALDFTPENSKVTERTNDDDINTTATTTATITTTTATTTNLDNYDDVDNDAIEQEIDVAKSGVNDKAITDKRISVTVDNDVSIASASTSSVVTELDRRDSIVCERMFLEKTRVIVSSLSERALRAWLAELWRLGYSDSYVISVWSTLSKVNIAAAPLILRDELERRRLRSSNDDSALAEFPPTRRNRSIKSDGRLTFSENEYLALRKRVERMIERERTFVVANAQRSKTFSSRVRRRIGVTAESKMFNLVEHRYVEHGDDDDDDDDDDLNCGEDETGSYENDNDDLQRANGSLLTVTSSWRDSLAIVRARRMFLYVFYMLCVTGKRLSDIAEITPTQLRHLYERGVCVIRVRKTHKLGRIEVSDLMVEASADDSRDRSRRSPTRDHSRSTSSRDRSRSTSSRDRSPRQYLATFVSWCDDRSLVIPFDRERTRRTLDQCLSELYGLEFRRARPRGLSFHALRRIYAGYRFLRGTNVDMLRETLDHADRTQTNRYINRCLYELSAAADEEAHEQQSNHEHGFLSR